MTEADEMENTATGAETTKATQVEKKIDVPDVVKQTTKPSSTAAPSLCGRLLLRITLCILAVVILGTAAALATGIHQLMTSTAIEPHTVNVVESARSPSTAVDITVLAHVESFPAQLSILLESARCGLVGGDELESVSIGFVSDRLLVASRDESYSPTATLSVASAAALRAQLAVWKATSATPRIECRVAAKVGVLASPAFIPLSIALTVNTNAEAAPLSFDGVSLGGGAILLRTSAAFRLDNLLTPTLGPLVKRGGPASSPLASMLSMMRGMAFDTHGWSAGLVRDEHDGLVTGAAVTSGPTPFGPKPPIGRITLSTNLQTELVSGSVEYKPPPAALDHLKETVPSLRHVFVSQSVLTMTMQMTSRRPCRSSSSASSSSSSSSSNSSAVSTDSEWVAHVAATLRPAMPVVDLWEMVSMGGAAQPALPIGFGLVGYDPASNGKGTFWPRKQPRLANALAAGPTTAANRLDVAGDVVTEGFLGQLLAALVEAPHHEASLNFDGIGANIDGLIEGAAARASYLASKLERGMEVSLGKEAADTVRRQLVQWVPPPVSDALSAWPIEGRALQSYVMDPVNFQVSQSNILGTGIGLSVTYNLAITDVGYSTNLAFRVPIDTSVEWLSALGLSTFGFTAGSIGDFSVADTVDVSASFEGSDAWLTDQLSLTSSTAYGGPTGSPLTTTGTLAAGGDFGTVAFVFRPEFSTCSAATMTGTSYATSDCSGTPTSTWTNDGSGSGEVRTTSFPMSFEDAWMGCVPVESPYAIRGEYCDFSGPTPMLKGVLYTAESGTCYGSSRTYGVTGMGITADGSCYTHEDQTSGSFSCLCSADGAGTTDVGPVRLSLVLTPTNSALLGTQQVSIAQTITGSPEGNLLYDVSVVQGSAQVDLAFAQILAGPDGAYGPPVFSLRLTPTNVDWLEPTLIWGETTWHPSDVLPIHVRGAVVLSEGTGQQTSLSYTFTEQLLSGGGGATLSLVLTPTAGFRLFDDPYWAFESTGTVTWAESGSTIPFPLGMTGFVKYGHDYGGGSIVDYGLSVSATSSSSYVSASMTPTNVDGLEAASFTISPSWSSSNFFPLTMTASSSYGAGSISIPNFSLNSGPGYGTLSVTINPTNIAWLPAATTLNLQPTWNEPNVLPLGLTADVTHGTSAVNTQFSLSGSDTTGSLTLTITPTNVDWLEATSVSLSPSWDNSNVLPIGLTSDFSYGAGSISTQFRLSGSDTSGSLTLTITPTNVDWLEATSVSLSPSWDNSNVLPIGLTSDFSYGAGSVSTQFSLSGTDLSTSLTVTMTPTNVAWLETTSVTSTATWNNPESYPEYSAFPIVARGSVVYGVASCGYSLTSKFASEPASILFQLAPNKIDWMVPMTFHLSSIKWSTAGYIFQVAGTVMLADGSPDNTFNIDLQPTTDQDALEVAGGVIVQLAALIAWIQAYQPPSPPPPFSPVETGGAVVEVVKVKVTVAGTVADWDTPARKLNVRQAFADRQNPPLPVEAVALTVSAASRRRLESLDTHVLVPTVVPPSHRQLSPGVVLDLSITAATPAMAESITADVNNNLASPTAMTSMIATAVPDLSVSVLEVAPTTTETAVLTADEVEELPDSFAENIEIEEGPDEPTGGLSMGIIIGAAGGAGSVVMLLLVYCCMCKKSSKSSPKVRPVGTELGSANVPATTTTNATASIHVPVVPVPTGMPVAITPHGGAPTLYPSAQPQVAPVAQPNFCSVCGSPLVPGAAFCTKCGNKVVG